MRILILGNNYSAKSFYYALEKNKDDIVFSTYSEIENSIKYTDEDDIVDFCEANEINFILITDEKYITHNLQEKLNSLNITVFAPTVEALDICRYKSSAKKFINKNKFPSPKYFIAEKPNLAIDYIKEQNLPCAIHPDTHSDKECVQFAETFGQAQKIVNKFFENGNKKIILEDYVQGKNFTVWTISDGYCAKIIGINAKYQNSVGFFEPEFVTAEIKENIIKNIINPAISSLANEEEYIGILGFDFMLNSSSEPILIGFNSFFDDISVDFYTNCYDINWLDVFESCIVGDMFSKYDFISDDEYALTIKSDNEIKFISAKIKSNLNKYVEELDCDTKDYKEAIELWKY